MMLCRQSEILDAIQNFAGEAATICFSLNRLGSYMSDWKAISIQLVKKTFKWSLFFITALMVVAIFAVNAEFFAPITFFLYSLIHSLNRLIIVIVFILITLGLINKLREPRYNSPIKNKKKDSSEPESYIWSKDGWVKK